MFYYYTLKGAAMLCTKVVEKDLKLYLLWNVD